MGWVTGIVVYILTWWVVLFAILPLWVRSRDPADEYYGTGAPQQPRMWLKAAVTSAVAAIVWAGIYVLVKEPWISFRGG
jgi:predicted secreted protein